MRGEGLIRETWAATHLYEPVCEPRVVLELGEKGLERRLGHDDTLGRVTYQEGQEAV
jgi:hypothetical protein